MTPRRALQLFAAVVILWAVADGAFAFASRDLPAALLLLFNALAGLSLLLWYRQDTQALARERSAPMGGAIVLLWVLAVPFYLWRSRTGRQKWRMLGAALAAGALFWLAFLLANLPAALRHAH